MNIFIIKCPCGEDILGPRLGGKARGQWLGHGICTKCRKAEADRHEGQAKPGETA